MNEDKIRPPMRHPADEIKVRPKGERDTVREAEEYAQRIIDAGGDDVTGYDEFHIDKDLQPDGWNYEWRRLSVAGKEDGFYQVDLARRGWRPVPAARHPELMPIGYRGANIEKKGLLLMERPEILTERAKLRD